MPQGQQKSWYGVAAFMKKTEDITFCSIAGRRKWENDR